MRFYNSTDRNTWAQNLNTNDDVRVWGMRDGCAILLDTLTVVETIAHDQDLHRVVFSKEQCFWLNDNVLASTKNREPVEAYMPYDKIMVRPVDHNMDEEMRRDVVKATLMRASALLDTIENIDEIQAVTSYLENSGILS